MSRELTTAYVRIRKQWPGIAIRQHQPRNKGWPDFVFIHGHVTFVEVKWFIDPTQVPVLEPTQHHWLNRLASYGATGLLLAGHGKHGHVLGCKGNGWLAWRAPLPKSFVWTRSIISGARLATPHPWWFGEHLSELSNKLVGK